MLLLSGALVVVLRITEVNSCGIRFRGLRGAGHAQHTDASLSGMASSAVHRGRISEENLWQQSGAGNPEYPLSSDLKSEGGVVLAAEALDSSGRFVCPRGDSSVVKSAASATSCGSRGVGPGSGAVAECSDTCARSSAEVSGCGVGEGEECRAPHAWCSVDCACETPTCNSFCLQLLKMHQQY